MLNSPSSIAFKTKGMQPQYPECATFYENRMVDVSTDGFMVCHNFRAKNVQLKGATLEAVAMDYLTGKVKPIAFVVVGARVTAYIDFEKNTGMKNANLDEGSIHDLIDESKKVEGQPLPELRPKTVKLVSKDFKKAKKPDFDKGPIQPPPAAIPRESLKEVSPALAGFVETSEEVEEEEEEEVEEEEEEKNKAKKSNSKTKKTSKSDDDEEG